MKYALLLLVCVSAAFALTAEQHFEGFMSTYNKRYYGAEYQYRLKVFAQNMEIARQRNLEDSATHGITQFSDLTPMEFRRKYLMKSEDGSKLARACLEKGIYQPHVAKRATVPDKFDWRDEEGAVNPVQNQASCGSCWAFSTAGNIEGVYGAKNKKSSGVLSSQFIVDCSKGCTSLIYQGKNTTVCNGGCGGGWPWSAMQDIVDQGGIPSDKDYPYKGYDQTCNTKPKPAVVISNYTCFAGPQRANEDEMRQFLIDNGPLSVALEADYFQSYKNGVLDPSSCQTAYLNHAVLLVGYGHDDASNKDYWLIKNSWGESWGEKGYVRLRRGVNRCGICEAISGAVL